MKKNKTINLLILITITILNISCDSKDGDCTLPEFDQKDISVPHQPQEITIKAKKNVNWWLHDLTIDGKQINILEDNDNVDITKNDYDVTQIKAKWFTITKINNKEIKMNLEQNNSRTDRSFTIQTYLGNCTEHIKVVQLAAK